MVTITYNANGGKGEMKPQAVESGVEVKLSANTFTKDGSDFTGWNEAADGSGKAYADGATVAPAGNLTLYAQWQVKSTPENPGTEDPDPENPGTENPGTEDPKPPVAKDNHITNLVLIKAVEDAYRQSSGSEFGWTKTTDGYVDMTNEGNKTLVEGVTSLRTNGDMFLNGIEYFTGLQELTLLNNSVLTKLPDLTSLSNLRTLVVTFTTESTADSSLTAVSGLPASLEKLDLSENKLTTLDVSKLTNLTYLMVFNNELTELDITNNTQLTVLSCFNNRMTALDITNVTAFSQAATEELTPILACGMQRNDSGLQELTLTATKEQKTALAPLFPTAEDTEGLDGYQLSNFNVVWDVPGAELDITEGTAVFEATSGLKLPFTVDNTGALTEEELTQLLANATKTVTLFTADNETGTQVQVDHISHGVDGSTPYILVATAAFPPGETTYSKIEVVLQAEGYETQTLTYTNVSVNPEQPGDGESDVDLQLTEGTPVFDAASGLKLPFEVGDPGSLPQEELTQLLANATKTVTLFTADNETGTPVETGISHGVDGSTPHISVPAAAFPPGETTYSKIEVVLQAEGYVTKTLTYTDVSVNVPKAELGITAGTADFNKTTGLTLSFGEGQFLPDNVNVDNMNVSLGGTQVDSQFNSERNAVIVDLEALTNDTVGMTVTVTVSADGYNDAVLTYEGVSTVWIPDGVTATFDGTEKIGGESVSVTISQADGTELSGVTISGTYSVVGEGAAEPQTIDVDGLSFTAPILKGDAAKDTGTEVTISLVLAKANAESVTVSSTLKVYPETHVRFGGEFYALAQGFNFTDANTLKGVTDGENAINEVSTEGYVFSIPPGNEKKSLNFPLRDSEKIVLTMIEAKWDRNNCANIFVAGLDATGKAAYGWSPFKGNYSFMLGEAASGADSSQRWNSKNDNVRLSVEPAENTFNKYFVFDNGEGNATLGFNDRVKLTTAAITSKADTTINRISSIGSNGAWPLTFQHANGDDKTHPVKYTLKTVAFYTTITP